MTKYNLINNGYFTTITGTYGGNISLTWEELDRLKDGNTTSSGISLLGTDVLCMEVDLSNRIKVDGVYLYTSSNTLNNIDFYYKNTLSGSYETLITQQNDNIYYTTIPSPSAPRCIITTVSGEECDIYEYVVLNDDYIVSFGEDGGLSEKYLDNAPIGGSSVVNSLAIYNSGTSSIPVNAYVCVDWTDNGADYFVDIAATEEGTWYNLSDGVILESEATDGIYNWSMGKFDNTSIVSDKVEITSGSGVGIYTTPIFSADPYSWGYFIINGSTDSYISNISYDASIYNGTIRTRSSSIAPEEYDAVFLYYRPSRIVGNVYKLNINDSSIDTQWNVSNIFDGSSIYDTFARSTAVCSKTGRVACADFFNYVYAKRLYITVLDAMGNELYQTTEAFVNNYLLNNSNISYFNFESSGGLWCYKYTTDKTTCVLFHINEHLNTMLYYGSFDYDVCSALSVEIGGTSIWYASDVDSSVVHMDSTGTILTTIVLASPTGIASNPEGGCWVFGSTDRKFYKYSSDGTLLLTKTVDHIASNMTTDLLGGFWYNVNEYVYHVNASGVTTVEVIVVANISYLNSGLSGCAVYSDTNRVLKWVDTYTGSVARSFTLSATTYGVAFPGVLSINYDSYKENHISSDLYPIDSDPIWGVGGSLGWKEVKKDGYFLSKEKYQQVEITLRSTGESPILNSIVVAPTIKLEDIPSNSGRNMYIKSNIPSSGEVVDYETKLKCWWGIKD